MKVDDIVHANDYVLNDDDDNETINSDIINPTNYYEKSKVFLRYNFFYDIYRSRCRCVFYSIMTIGLIVVFSPLYVFKLEQFGFNDSIFHKITMKSNSLENSQYSMLSILIPMIFDTFMDMIHQKSTINFEIHERLIFMIITLTHSIVNISYYGTLKGTIYYIFINQASVIIANCCVFSTLTKLERSSHREMITILLGFVLIIIGSTIKMYGFIYENIMNTGIVISIIGNIIQLLNSCFWMLKILNITNIELSGLNTNYFSKISLTDAEISVIIYFSIFITWIIAVFISNTVTNSISWKSSTIPNILSFEIIHILLVFVVVVLPTRLTKMRQKAAFESITKLSNKLESEHMILTQVLPNDAVKAIQKDIEGFTDLSSKIQPQEIMYMLDELYSIMDYVTTLFKTDELLKIETIGDAYMLVSGISDINVDHVRCITDYALIVRKVISLVLNPITQEPLRIRIGIHTGPVCAGIVGFLTPHWSLFGDTVNTAARMETNSSPGSINVSESTAHFLIKSDLYDLTKREKIIVKGKGEMQTYWVNDYKDGNYIDSFKLEKVVEDCKVLIAKCKSNRQDIDSLNSIEVE